MFACDRKSELQSGDAKHGHDMITGQCAGRRRGERSAGNRDANYQ